jgi:peptidoglycan/LPS O-acetylase OafA/YrhL
VCVRDPALSTAQQVPSSYADGVADNIAESLPSTLTVLADLDKRDTAVLKGIAISAIVLHNFFHVVSPAHENEFTFDPGRFQQFIQTVRQPALAIQALFSFFGHYGVGIFIFLSAFGLAKSHWDDPANWATFMARRIRKLYPVFGSVVVPWIIVVAIQFGPLTVIKRVGLQLPLMFIGLSPFLPTYGLPPIGPWWFIAFVVQFYAIWPLLRKLTNRFGWAGLLSFSVLCLVLTIKLNTLLAPWSINLLETPFGRMPCICFGIIAARFPVRIRSLVALGSGAIVLLGSWYATLWSFTSIAALIFFLWTYVQLRCRLRDAWLIERIGRYSALIFLLNAIVRNHLVPLATSPASQLFLGFLNAGVSLALAALIQELLFPIPDERRKGEMRFARRLRLSAGAGQSNAELCETYEAGGERH